MKTKIPSLSYNAMFKAVFGSNKNLLSKLIEAILDYYRLDIDIKGKELIIKNNELPIDNYYDRELICDYVIKLDEYHSLNIEVNRTKYNGLAERNLTYSFKIFYEHFKSGDKKDEFSKYTLLQVNFNNYHNPDNKCIDRYYLLNIDNVGDKLTNNYSIMNVDIASCYKLVYNKTNLDDISNLEIFGAIISCNYLEDIASILERGLTIMTKREKEAFLNDVRRASQNEEVAEDLRLESSIETRIKYFADMAKADAKEELAEEVKEEVTKQVTKEVTKQVTKEVTKQVTKEVTKQVTKEVTKQVTKDMINNMLKEKLSYKQISNITGKSIDEIIKIEKDN